MMVFVSWEQMVEISESEEPDAALAGWMRRHLGLPAVADEQGLRATRGRLDVQHVSGGEVRIMWHEVH
jgi:hypothetical protein